MNTNILSTKFIPACYFTREHITNYVINSLFLLGIYILRWTKCRLCIFGPSSIKFPPTRSSAALYSTIKRKDRVSSAKNQHSACRGDSNQHNSAFSYILHVMHGYFISLALSWRVGRGSFTCTWCYYLPSWRPEEGGGGQHPVRLKNHSGSQQILTLSSEVAFIVTWRRPLLD
jgi:hypothetical protein